MPTRSAAPAHSRRGPLRSPLAAVTQSPLPPICPPTVTSPAPSQPEAADPRSLALAEFGDYLRTINNRDGRPYEDATINAYVFPAKALDAWMTANGLDGDFTTVDTAILNRYFREYYQAHGQGGTHTQQRNLIQLFNYLQREARTRAVGETARRAFLRYWTLASPGVGVVMRSALAPIAQEVRRPG